MADLQGEIPSRRFPLYGRPGSGRLRRTPLSRRPFVPFVLPLIFALAAATSPPALAAPAQVRVLNLSPGTTLRYPVALLTGEADVADGSPLTVVNNSSRRPSREFRTAVLGKRFKALVELVPGANRLTLSVGRVRRRFNIRYKPQTNPYIVRFMYFTDQSGDTAYQTEREADSQDFAAKIDTAAKLMQTFTAEQLSALGHGHKTFNLELDDDGRVQVHVVRGPEPASHYYGIADGQLYGEINSCVQQQLPNALAKNVVIMAFTRYDAADGRVRGHTALGGGNLGLFGGSGMFSWPSRLQDVQPAFSDETPVDAARSHDDSAGRSTYWGLASTTLGAVLHEAGHCLNLPHSPDRFDIMSRGFDHLNRVFTLVEPPHARRPEPLTFADTETARFGPVSGARLAYHRHFHLDERDWQDEPAPRVEVDPEKGTLIVEAAHGIRVVGINGDGESRDNDVFTADPPKHLEYRLSEITRRGGGKSVSLIVIDDQGNQVDVPPGRLVNPADFVRAWRLSPQALPWPATDELLSVSAERIAALHEQLAARPITTSSQAFVDLTAHFPAPTDNRVAYAFRTMHSDTDMPVVFCTGSDDALRVWLNGEPVVSKLVLRPPSPDAERTPVTLRSGANNVLVEVSNAGGGWGFFLRIEDQDGTKLVLEADGTVRPAAE